MKLGIVAASRPKSAPVLNVWAGADPTAQVDATAYEMGTQFQINAAITIVGCRLWNPGSQPRTSRSVKLWSVPDEWFSGTVVRETLLPDTLPAGWSVWTWPTSLVLSAGFPLKYMVSYDVGPASPPYGAVGGAFASPITTPDGKVSIPQNGGRFNGSTDTFPESSFNNAFYGVDLRYS